LWGSGSEMIANDTLFIGERTRSFHYRLYRIAMML
jgi:hypothetical protein